MRDRRAWGMAWLGVVAIVVAIAMALALTWESRGPRRAVASAAEASPPRGATEIGLARLDPSAAPDGHAPSARAAIGSTPGAAARSALTLRGRVFARKGEVLSNQRLIVDAITGDAGVVQWLTTSDGFGAFSIPVPSEHADLLFVRITTDAGAVHAAPLSLSLRGTTGVSREGSKVVFRPSTSDVRGVVGSAKRMLGAPAADGWDLGDVVLGSHEIRGRVVDTARTPIEGANVRAEPFGSDQAP